MALLAERVAIVTGGTGGLGAAVVAALLAEGASVFVPTRRDGEIARVQQEFATEQAARLTGASVDLTDPASVDAAYRQVAALHGGIDLLVNVAGGFGGGRPVHETDWSLWQEQLDINLKTCVNSCHSAIPQLIARGGGAIVNVSSRTALQSGAHLAAYAAAKRAVIQLTESLADELRDQQITANVVLPSVIDTPTNRQAMPAADHARWVKPAEIAQVILFLCGPHARIISGATIPVYGRV
ncbi:MAG: SDR family NAD(P)-dependent oxidoreductase [Roseiflexaceae bacterium]